MRNFPDRPILASLPILVLAAISLGSSAPPIVGSGGGPGSDEAPSVPASALPAAKLVPEDGDSEQFGQSVAIAGNRVVVGAPPIPREEDDPNARHGVAYVFEREGAGRWRQTVRLVGQQTKLDNFGGAVAIQGGRVAIGANGDDGVHPRSGAVYVYRLVRKTGAWILEARLTPHDAADHVDWWNGHRFGSSVAFLRGGLAIGAPCDNVCTGAVYIFERHGKEWVEGPKLLAPDGRPEESFGGAIAAHGRRLVAGPALVGDGQGRLGAAYVFGNSGGAWQQTARLVASDRAESFSSVVAMRGGVIVVAAPGSGPAGAAYVFVRKGSDWIEASKLERGDVTASFGGSLAVSRGRVIVGAPRDQSVANLLGTAFSFSGPSWSNSSLLVPDDLDIPSGFGASIAMHGKRTVIGAPGLEAAWVFE